jgi:hypothetical protein
MPARHCDISQQASASIARGRRRWGSPANPAASAGPYDGAAAAGGADAAVPARGCPAWPPWCGRERVAARCGGRVALRSRPCLRARLQRRYCGARAAPSSVHVPRRGPTHARARRQLRCQHCCALRRASAAVRRISLACCHDALSCRRPLERRRPAEAAQARLPTLFVRAFACGLTAGATARRRR